MDHALELALRIAGLDAAAQDAGMPLSAEEEAVMAGLEARLLKKLKAAKKPKDDDSENNEDSDAER